MRIRKKLNEMSQILRKKENVELYTPQSGYDIAAPFIEDWHWFDFWKENESPYVNQWLSSLSTGFGLDAGCGIAPYRNIINNFAHTCISLDLSENMLKKSIFNKKKMPQSLVQGDIQLMPFIECTFDWILCTRVFSHLKNLNSVVNEFSRIMKSGSQCLITDIHADHPYDHVGIDINDCKIKIQTYKHTIDSITSVIKKNKSLYLMNIKIVKLMNLNNQPDVFQYEKLYQFDNTPIFYLIYIRKQ